jgi:transposase
MKYVQGKDRHQSRISTHCLDETVDADNPVRIIDAFVDSLPLETFGFRLDYREEGRPAYHPSDLLKLYIYGYQNRIRSSRGLEAECKRNIELFWLMKELRPDHNTINRFRKDNADAIRQVFRATVKTAQNLNLIGGTLLAGDSTKLRAQNSKKNNYNTKKIKRHIEYIDRKLDEYNQHLAQADGDDNDEPGKNDGAKTKKEIAKHKEHRQRYQDLQKQLDQSGQDQISTSDPDSRQMIIRGQITEVAYNVQSTVDAQHNIPIDFEVTNHNDSKAMGPLLERAVDVLGHNKFTALFDKGYHTTSEFVKAHELQVDVMVAIPGTSAHAPHPDFDLEHFSYNHQKDQYTCPARKVLRSNGTWYNNQTKTGRFKQYKTTACKSCVLSTACTKSRNGRILQRNEHAHLNEQNKARILENPKLYKQRQAIVEHPFGTMKRQWGFDHIMTKKFIHHAAADVGLVFVAYNLKRLMALVSPEELKALFGKHLGRLFGYILSILAFKWHLTLISAKINNLSEFCAFLFERQPRPTLYVMRWAL